MTTQRQNFTAEDIERDFKSGPPNGLTAQQAILALQRLGVAQPEAILQHWQGGGTGTIVGPGQGRVAQSLSQVPDEDLQRFQENVSISRPGVRTATPIDQTANERRQRLIDEETRNAAFRRGGQQAVGTQNFRGPVQRALSSPFEQFLGTRNIINFENPANLGDQFAAFLQGDRPTREGLSAALTGALEDTRGGDPRFAELFEQRFTNVDAKTPLGEFQPAFTAALQPLLAGINPRLRGNIQRGFQNQFENQLARDPITFGSARDLIEAFRAQGFS